MDAIPSGLRVASGFSWRLLVVAAGLAVLICLIIALRHIVVPFLVALLVCALLGPISAFLQRHRWPKWAAVTSSLVALIVVIAGVVAAVSAQVQADIPLLERELHRNVVVFQALLDHNALGVSSQDIDRWISAGTAYVQTHTESVLSVFKEAGTGAVHAIEGVFIIIFATIFILIDGRRIWSWVVRLFPKRGRPRLEVAGAAGWRTVTSFIRVQLVVAFTDALGVVIAALSMQIPLAFPIGVLVFLGAFVPVVGAIVTGTVAVVITLVFKGWVAATVMLGIVVLVAQLESHVLHPLLTGSVVKVHPLAVVLGVAAGTSVAGIVGAFFAVPVIATVNSMVHAAASWKGSGDGPAANATQIAGSRLRMRRPRPRAGLSMRNRPHSR